MPIITIVLMQIVELTIDDFFKAGKVGFDEKCVKKNLSFNELSFKVDLRQEATIEAFDSLKKGFRDFNKKLDYIEACFEKEQFEKVKNIAGDLERNSNCAFYFFVRAGMERIVDDQQKRGFWCLRDIGKNGLEEELLDDLSYFNDFLLSKCSAKSLKLGKMMARIFDKISVWVVCGVVRWAGNAIVSEKNNFHQFVLKEQYSQDKLTDKKHNSEGRIMINDIDYAELFICVFSYLPKVVISKLVKLHSLLSEELIEFMIKLLKSLKSYDCSKYGGNVIYLFDQYSDLMCGNFWPNLILKLFYEYDIVGSMLSSETYQNFYEYIMGNIRDFYNIDIVRYRETIIKNINDYLVKFGIKDFINDIRDFDISKIKEKIKEYAERTNKYTSEFGEYIQKQFLYLKMVYYGKDFYNYR